MARILSEHLTVTNYSAYTQWERTRWKRGLIPKPATRDNDRTNRTPNRAKEKESVALFVNCAPRNVESSSGFRAVVLNPCGLPG